MNDYLSNQSNHYQTCKALENKGVSGDYFGVRFSHPLLLMSRKANKINAFRLFCSLLKSFRILPANNNHFDIIS